MNSKLPSSTKYVFCLLIISNLAMFLAFQSCSPIGIDLGQLGTRLLQGFYDAEYDSSYGRMYRWTQQDASVRFPNPWRLKPFILHINARTERFGDQVHTTTVAVNGLPIGIINKAGWRDWNFTIADSRVLDNDELLVSFHSTVFVPAEMYDSSVDDRELGVAISHIDIRAQSIFPFSPTEWFSSLVIPPIGELIVQSLIIVGLYGLARASEVSTTHAFVFTLLAIFPLIIRIIFFRLADLEFDLLSIFIMGMLILVYKLTIPYRPEQSKESLRDPNWTKETVAPQTIQNLLSRGKRAIVRLAFLCFVVLLSLFTVNSQVQQLGQGYLHGRQTYLHTSVLRGDAPDPWQYRILSEYLVEGTISILKYHGIADPTVTGFILFRVFQNCLLFLLVALYYRKLGLHIYASALGMALLAWGMMHALYDSDLQFNTYSDVIFYLLGAIVILYGKYLWIIPITMLAASNRETSGLIPLMLVAIQLMPKTAQNKTLAKTTLIIATAALVSFFCVYGGIRYLFGPHQPFNAYGNNIGVPLFLYNIDRDITWIQLFATLSVIPFIAIVSLRFCPRILQGFFLAIVPIWLFIHLFASILAETRLLLVPQALVFIPSALFGLINRNHRKEI